MQTIELRAEKRDLASKGTLSQLRLNGQIPAVVYGGKKAPENLALNLKNLIHLLKGHGVNVLMNLKLGDGAEVVLLKDVQRDVLSHDVIHVDFQRMSMTEKLEINVPLNVTGEAPGVKMGGGIMEHILRNLKVRCLPTDIPDNIPVDVSHLQLNQGIKVKDLVAPAGVDILNDREGLVVNIVAPAAEEVAATPAAGAVAAGTEPEVIAKGKKPEEGEDAAGAKPSAAGKAAPAPAKGAPAAKEKK
ncbi:MAG: 50S ribosomal protein L25 [Elusimicrobia bacterium]|nr:50S ribosomal protein L25 [Elusimicrobiota bacterium]